ncbi:thioredoxin domain-containing protein [Mycobacterium sp. CVI_P3]|uniref:Thioredoxin domain-containing protein n=1 Tax=Mycobacterium pinniadriaticum TaxID=2994102 RepID=A0ABT3SBK1_9MYCO|nr:thioredoxin domain-containing protein [Mycobacterium pinniadriaticum]MCX2930462.1 thioredoxin domain-containing protein [Mycobacterium pinniadriaticum]MCX2936886.1 thioredoxin domain-containing protein [Mycobacterium pinniadriaticum]
MATNKKSAPRYDLKAQDRRRNLIIQLGLTAIVVIFAVALVLYIVMGHDKKVASGDAQAVRITSPALIKKDGTDEPKAVLSLYEDFQCPHCKEFEKDYGPTITKLVDAGAVATDYYMVAILNSPVNKNYSTRAANAAYCVADENKEAFLRFHGALFAQQPEEGSANVPDNNALIETARQAGVVGGVPQCINSGKYDDMVNGLAAAAKISATPTVRLNGEDISPASPEDLVAKVKAVVGNVPGLDGASTPAPAAPAPATPAPVAP